MAEGHTIETYGRGSYNRNIWRAPHNRNIWPYNSQAAAPPSRLADSFVCAGSGTLITTICTSGHALLLAEHGALGQLYADDTQAYMHCVSSKAATTVRAMGQTLTALETWTASNRLCLNPAKTKFMWLGTPQQLAKLNLIDLSAEFPNYTFSSSVRDLGIILDQALTFAPHLNRLSRDCFYHLRQLRTVARSLSPGAAATIGVDFS